MSLEDFVIKRIYRCTNNECAAVLSFDQKYNEKWKKRCPLCKKHSLLLESGTTSITTFIDLTKPKTFGSASDENKKRREKENPIEKPKKPWWRKSNKINYNVLKNPKKYIDTGTV